MPTNLPSDPVMLEQAIAAAIRDTLLSVPLIADNVNVYTRQRFPDSEARDIELSTRPDRVNSELTMTSIMEIGIPTVNEKEYTGDTCTQVDFVYPINFDFGIKDEWDEAATALLYPNSREFCMACYMLARAKFKFNRTFGYNNCVHQYLQQDQAGVVEDEETGGRLHVADWSITVQCTGVLV